MFSILPYELKILFIDFCDDVSKLILRHSCKLYHEKTPKIRISTCDLSRENNKKRLEWVTTQYKYPLKYEILEVAAIYGSYDVFKWTIENGFTDTHDLDKIAARYDQRSILSLL